MKPNVVAATTSTPISSPLTALPTAKIVQHPRATKVVKATLTPPDEETLKRLNVLAKQFPFCIRHRGTNSPIL
jgi:hypothetical protein